MLDPPIVYYLVFSRNLPFLRPINRKYSLLLFDYNAYYASNMGKRCVFVIYIHKGKCNSLIFILLIFCLMHRKKSGHNKVVVFMVLHFVKIFVWYQLIFTPYSYYRDFFCLGPESCLGNWHYHVWVRYFRYYKKYGLVYVIDINTHDLFFCLYNMH